MAKPDSHKISITLIGTGNVSWHLCGALQKTNYQIKAIAGRNTTQLNTFRETFQIPTCSIEELPESDIVLIAVSDNAIEHIARQLKNPNAIIAHTSGAMDLEVLPVKNKGVFYPFQTFTKEKALQMERIPFFIEGSSPLVFDTLTQLAQQISGNVFPLDTQKRELLHLAGVYANNFVNYLFLEAERFLEKGHLPREVLYPLIEETVDKMKQIGPKNAQTGPAVRNDALTLSRHLNTLANHPDQMELYKLISRLIQSNQKD